MWWHHVPAWYKGRRNKRWKRNSQHRAGKNEEEVDEEKEEWIVVSMRSQQHSAAQLQNAKEASSPMQTCLASVMVYCAFDMAVLASPMVVTKSMGGL